MQISRIKRNGQPVVKTLVKDLASISEFWRRLVESLESKQAKVIFLFVKLFFSKLLLLNACISWTIEWAAFFFKKKEKKKTNLSNLKASDAALLWEKQGPLCVWPSTALKQKREKTWTWVDEAKLFFYFSTTKTIPYPSLLLLLPVDFRSYFRDWIQSRKTLKLIQL